MIIIEENDKTADRAHSHISSFNISKEVFKLKILVAEDEKDLNRIITKKLSSEGYSIDSCYDGEAALDFIEFSEYDAVILDIMMPKLNGLEVLKKMRASGNATPVLCLTARDRISDRVEGLDEGADDYLVKPFDFEELLARLRVMTRRAVKSTSNRFEIADLSVDCKTRIVKRGNNRITLSAKEFSILEYMIRNKGVVLSREKIENNIWNLDYAGGSNVIDVYIRYLRKKIDEGYDKKLLHTVRGAGYVLREES